MKYAILEHGGKQYLAEEGGRIEVDRMALDEGKTVEFKDVLLVADGKQIEVGSPYVSGARVKGTVVEHAKSRKIIVFKFKPKQRYRRKQGHRQPLTRISIEAVALPGAELEDGAPAEASSAKGGAKSSTKSSSAVRSSKRAAKSTTRKAASAAAGKVKTSTKKSGSKPKAESGGGKDKEK